MSGKSSMGGWLYILPSSMFTGASKDLLYRNSPIHPVEQTKAEGYVT